jgi:archaeosine synthase beta-subunit
MNEIASYCKDLKKDFSPKIKDPAKPVSFWSEKDVLKGDIVNAFVIIFRTRGCTWAMRSGCSMCGYFNDSLWAKVTDENLLKQFDLAMEKYSGEKFVKIFTSGSFLDGKEISKNTRNKILAKLYETAEKVSVESRPEFIQNETLKEIKKISENKIFEVGVGLETASDYIRKNSINKGFTFEEYKKAVKKLKKFDFKIKTYILIKPPYLTEKESIEDAVESVKKIKNMTDAISFNPTNIQRKTFVEYLWKRKKYRASYLFSVVEILKQSKKIAPNVFIKCDISGGGNIRGPHNCRDCDRKYLDAISNFSLNQNTKIFEGLTCNCKDKWLDLLDIENLSFGSIIDV